MQHQIKICFSSSSDENEILENFRKIGQERTENDEIERRIFDRSKNKNDNLDVQRFIRAVRKTGLKLSDPRLTDVRTNLDNCQNFIIENVDEETVDTGIDFDCFKGKISTKPIFAQKLPGLLTLIAVIVMLVTVSQCRKQRQTSSICYQHGFYPHFPFSH